MELITARYIFYFTFHASAQYKFFYGGSISAEFKAEHNVSIKQPSANGIFSAFETFLKDHNIEDAKVFYVSEPN